MGVYPNPTKCPEGIYNMWCPFAGETLPIRTVGTDAIDRMNYHIIAMCGDDENVAWYMKMWIAQMIQFPDVKTNCPILISKEGAGKGTLLRLISKMIGKKKYMESPNPSRDVWGNFNGKMATSFLVNLNEMSKKDTVDAMGQIKALITDSELNINEKGISQYTVTSYHRFIITTNNEDPIDTKQDDRRFWIVRASDKLLGDTEYFDEFNKMLDDPMAISEIYQYFKTLVGYDGDKVARFHEIPKPTTAYQQNIQEANTDTVIQWLIYLSSCNDKDTLEMTGSDTTNMYNDWARNNGLDYKMNSKKIGKKLANMVEGFTQKGRHTMRGETRVLLLKKIRDTYGIVVHKTMDDDDSIML